MEICERSFELVVKHLAALNYTGPVGLSCDDTKLFSAMCLYWDAEQKSHFLVGGVDGLYHVANADQVKSVLETANIQKAAKIRLWCLTIPALKMTPIIVAAIPIANDLDASVLLSYLKRVLYGLLEWKVQVVSYACDGTEVEHAVQRLLIKKSEEKIERSIPNPHPNSPDTKNHSISHQEHIKMVLWAWYFLDSWEAFLDHSSYKKAQYSLSPLSVTANEMMNVQELAQTSDKQLEEVIAEEYQQLCKMQADLPNIQAPDEILKPLGHGGITVNDLNFTPLVEMHHRHQTRQAALGVQTRSSKSTDTESTLKQGIIQHMHNGALECTGNAANAAAATVTLAKQAATH
ncbi:hypothetical protein L208DRAFT_1374531 [Tricholoma matsutake]|nr:hypothetical protein L208DRAFT_1374531 [Tricholoma matsutake 945]